MSQGRIEASSYCPSLVTTPFLRQVSCVLVLFLTDARRPWWRQWPNLKSWWSLPSRDVFVTPSLSSWQLFGFRKPCLTTLNLFLHTRFLIFRVWCHSDSYILQHTIMMAVHRGPLRSIFRLASDCCTAEFLNLKLLNFQLSSHTVSGRQYVLRLVNTTTFLPL